MVNALWLGALLTSSVAMTQVEGSVTYRERLALPDGCSLVIAIDHFGETSQTNLSELTMRLNGGQVPIKFTLSYLPNRSGSTGVRAEIRDHGRVLFQSERHTMLTQGSKTLELVLKRAVDSSEPSFTGTTWELVALTGEALSVTDNRPTLSFDSATGRISGFGGVNRFGGEFLASPGQIQIDPGASTLMAGEPERMQLESRFIALLPSVNRWSVFEGRLTLLRGDRELASFKKWSK